MIGPRVSVVFSDTMSLVKLKSVINPVTTVMLRSFVETCVKKAYTYMSSGDGGSYTPKPSFLIYIISKCNSSTTK